MPTAKRLTKSERSRIKIMHVAKGLYEKQGIDNVTYNQIAAAADMCRSTVFNHFPTANDLMSAIYEQEIIDIDEYCKAGKLEGEDLIRAFFDKLIEDTAIYPTLTLQLTGTALISGEKSAAIREIEKRVSESLPERDSLSDKEREEKAILIVGAYYGLVNHYHAYGKPFDEKHLKKEFSSMLDKLLKL